MLKEKLQAEMKNAMRAKDKVKLETIRSILSAMQYEEIQKQTEALSDEAGIAILKTEIKKRKEALEYAEKGNRPEAAATLHTEIAVIESFLPSQMSEAQLEEIITGYKTAQPEIAMGQIMKLLKEQYAGQYDGKVASAVAKRLAG